MATVWSRILSSLWSASNYPWKADYLPWQETDTNITTSWTSRTEPTTSYTKRTKPTVTWTKRTPI